ncbi:hypothetical protein [endosymbiont 'TC1' of Trimyema compressum]|uniref:hypothetical protein n=1 Tax=endosymbiont 'TC1' of Trimyema compressum TaxID=243899 RepID=UPI0013923E75|nr:hypothetical protein [endosymbiont 'TC1' of Trimyema compressum]
MKNRIQSIGRIFLLIGIVTLLFAWVIYFLKIIWLTIVLGLISSLFSGAFIGLNIKQQ